MRLEKHKIYYLQTHGTMSGVQWIMPISDGVGYDKKPFVNMLVCVELITLQNLPKHDNVKDYMITTKKTSGYFDEKIEYITDYPNDSFWRHWCVNECILDNPDCICIPLETVEKEYPKLMMIGSRKYNVEDPANIYARGISGDALKSFKRELLLKKILHNER